jgi:hypothetical protein
VKRTPFDQAKDGLKALLGAAASEPSVIAELRGIDTELHAFAVGLERLLPMAWHTSGLTLDHYPGPSGKRRLSGYVESADVTFQIELVSGDFYDNYAELGWAPESFYVEAEVYVVSDGPIDVGNELVNELPVHESATATQAVASLAQALAALRRNSSRRPPTAASWRAAQESA